MRSRLPSSGLELLSDPSENDRVFEKPRSLTCMLALIKESSLETSSLFRFVLAMLNVTPPPLLLPSGGLLLIVALLTMFSSFSFAPSKSFRMSSTCSFNSSISLSFAVLSARRICTYSCKLSGSGSVCVSISLQVTSSSSEVNSSAMSSAEDPSSDGGGDSSDSTGGSTSAVVGIATTSSSAPTTSILETTASSSSLPSSSSSLALVSSRFSSSLNFSSSLCAAAMRLLAYSLGILNTSSALSTEEFFSNAFNLKALLPRGKAFRRRRLQTPCISFARFNVCRVCRYSETSLRTVYKKNVLLLPPKQSFKQCGSFDSM